MFSRSSIFSLVLSLLAGFAAGQTAPDIRVSADKQKILLGEPFTLTIEASYAAGTPVLYKGIDSIPHFERLEEPKTDSSLSNGRVTIREIHKLTSFDSGHWVIPSFSLTKKLRSDTLGIDVVFSEFDSSQNYHDIKDIIDVNVQEKINWWWYMAGGGLLLLLLIIYFIRKRKTSPETRHPVAVDPYTEAMEELEQLRRSHPEFKQYHTRLAAIFRLYVYRKKGILSLQKTTDDLLIRLKDKDLPREEWEALCQALRLGDMVKFAKYNPAETDNQTALEVIRNAITRIEKQEQLKLPEGGNR